MTKWIQKIMWIFQGQKIGNFLLSTAIQSHLLRQDPINASCIVFLPLTCWLFIKIPLLLERYLYPDAEVNFVQVIYGNLGHFGKYQTLGIFLCFPSIGC